MSRFMRSIIMFFLIAMLLVSSTAVSAAFNGSDWRGRHIHILCGGDPGACPCPGC